MGFFRSPWPIVIIIVAAILLFGANKLPSLARNMGKSMRIFKSEVEELRGDEKHEDELDEDRPARSSRSREDRYREDRVHEDRVRDDRPLEDRAPQARQYDPRDDVAREQEPLRTRGDDDTYRRD